MMTIDERLERLLERQEILMKAVEILANSQRQTEQRMLQILEAISRMVHIAEMHEQRIDDLGRNRPF